MSIFSLLYLEFDVSSGHSPSRLIVPSSTVNVLDEVSVVVIRAEQSLHIQLRCLAFQSLGKVTFDDHGVTGSACWIYNGFLFDLVFVVRRDLVVVAIDFINFIVLEINPNLNVKLVRENYFQIRLFFPMTYFHVEESRQH